MAGVGVVIVIAASVVGLLVLLAVGFLVVRRWYRVAKADEALVIVGKKQRASDGSDSRITVITGGGAIVNALTQRAEMISLRARQIKMEPTAQSSNGVTVNVSGVALVKIGSDPESVRRAAERFASQDRAVDQFTTEQLEGALRGVVATLTVEELMRDRQRLSDEIAEGIKNDLSSQGLILDSFQIQGITDTNGYIAALGASEVERVKYGAEVAKINADREIRTRQIATDEANLVEQTALDKNAAAAAAEVGRARAEAEQAQALARAERQQAVLVQEAQNTRARLESDVGRVADAELYQRQRQADADAYAQVKAAEAFAQIAEQEATAVRLRAQADSEAVRLAGQARAEAIGAEAEALSRNQEALLAQRALDALVPMMTEFARGYERVGSVTVLGGEGASGHLAAESAAGMRASFDAVYAATGIDLASIVSGRASGAAAGEAAGEAVGDAVGRALDDVVGTAVGSAVGAAVGGVVPGAVVDGLTGAAAHLADRTDGADGADGAEDGTRERARPSPRRRGDRD